MLKWKKDKNGKEIIGELEDDGRKVILADDLIKVLQNYGYDLETNGDIARWVDQQLHSAHKLAGVLIKHVPFKHPCFDMWTNDDVVIGDCASYEEGMCCYKDSGGDWASCDWGKKFEPAMLVGSMNVGVRIKPVESKESDTYKKKD